MNIVALKTAYLVEQVTSKEVETKLAFQLPPDLASATILAKHSLPVARQGIQMQPLDLRRHIAHIGITAAVLDLELQGYDVQVNGHNHHDDLIINESIRVEVKASLWTSHKTRKGRYQFNTRQTPDFYILYCLGHNRTAFVIPGKEIGSRKNIAIWSLNPWKYAGQWAPYREAWQVIEQEQDQCQNQPAPYTDDA